MPFEHMEEKEAVERAALIEKNGQEFYTLMAEKTTDERARTVFKMLATDEKRHLKTLEKKYFPEAGFPDYITDEELEIEKYVKELGVPDLFTKRVNIEKLVALIDEPKKALIIALDTERHSVIYFEGLAKTASSEEARVLYEELAEEERTHEKHILELIEAD